MTTIVLAHDEDGFHQKVDCSTLVFFSDNGAMAKIFDIPDSWKNRCKKIEIGSLPGEHFCRYSTRGNQ